MKKVSFAKFLGILFLIPSLFILGAALYIGPHISTISGVLIFIVSIMYITRPAGTYDDAKLEIKNLYGMTLKTYYFGKDKFSVRDNKIYANDRKVKLSSVMLVQSEYQDLLAHVSSISGGGSGKIGSSKAMSDDDILDSGL